MERVARKTETEDDAVDERMRIAATGKRKAHYGSHFAPEPVLRMREGERQTKASGRTEGILSDGLGRPCSPMTYRNTKLV